MVEFVCKDREIEKNLRLLYRQVIENGGLVYDGLTIAADRHGFTISVDKKKPAGERIIVLPKQCLIPVDHFRLGLAGEEIVIKGYDGNVTPAQAAMMQTIIALYNLTGKIKTQKQICSLALFYKDRALFDLIISRHNKVGMPYLEKMVLSDEKNFYLDSFIKTRVLGFRSDFDAPAGVAAKASGGRARKKKTQASVIMKNGEVQPSAQASAQMPVRVIMPLIDFINHYPQAPGFFTSYQDKKKPGEDEQSFDPAAEGVSVVKFCPFSDSQEIFVNYGFYDAADTFIHYNYVDANANYVRSTPLKISVPGVGTLAVLGLKGRPEAKKIPENLKDLSFFIPFIRPVRDKKLVELGSLLIPQARAPRALRRVLGLAIKQLQIPMDEATFMQAILTAEKKVIEENLAYYREILDFTAGRKVRPGTAQIVANARLMAETQIAKIEAYPFYKEIFGRKSAARRVKKMTAAKQRAGKAATPAGRRRREVSRS